MSEAKFEFEGKKWKSIKDRLRRRNARFEAMTRTEQRVAIAKDVIEQVRDRKLVAQSANGYLEMTPFRVPTQWGGRDYAPGLLDRDLSECTSQVTCTVCGIGSLFVSTVEFNDKLKFSEEVSARYKQVEYLQKWFSGEQLNLVEDYFECYDPSSESPIRREADDDDRLIMIMENIISNSGKFNPSRGKHAIDRDD